MTDLARQLGLEPRRLAARWGWFVALGVVMVIAGGFALGDTVLVTLVSVLFIGAALLIAGIFQVIHAFANKGWGAFLLALRGARSTFVGGLLIMDEPVNGSVLITDTVVFAVSGVVRVVMALRHRELKGWWLILLGGVIGVAVAVLLYTSLPWSSLWLLGTLIAIELIFNGIGWIMPGFALRGEARVLART
jgi:uncharacterized membrane protein HdeD (DUF308 family)